MEDYKPYSLGITGIAHDSWGGIWIEGLGNADVWWNNDPGALESISTDELKLKRAVFFRPEGRS